MKKVAVLVAACSLLMAACVGGPSEPEVKAPTVSEGRVTAAKIAGRELPIYTFTGVLKNDKAEIGDIRVIYSISGDLYKREGGKVELISPVTLQAQLVKRLNQLRYITDKVKDHDLEAHFEEDGAKIAFFWEVDYKAPGGQETHTYRSIVYETDIKDITRHDLGREIKP